MFFVVPFLNQNSPEERLFIHYPWKTTSPQIQPFLSAVDISPVKENIDIFSLLPAKLLIIYQLLDCDILAK